MPNLETRRGAPVTKLGGASVSTEINLGLPVRYSFFPVRQTYRIRAHTEEKYHIARHSAAERFVAAPAVPTPCTAPFPELLTRPIASVAVPGRASAHASRWALGV